MTDYVSNEFFALFFKGPDAGEALLQRVGDGLEQNSPYRVCQRWLSPRGRVALLNVALREVVAGLPAWRDGADAAAALANPLRLSAHRAVVQAGYTTSPTAQWDAGLRRTGAGLTCADAGGIAAFAAVLCEPQAEEALFLWSTRPGLRSIAVAESAELIVAGTRPYWVHRIAQAFERVQFEPAYVLESLAGWSLGDRTPYAETALISVDALLRIQAGVRTLHAHPTPAYARAPRLPWHPERERYQAALREAVEPLRELSGFELRMSGGKDSRLVAAALSAAGITPSTAVCHGLEGEWETPLAARVAGALGWPLKCVVPEFAYRSGIHATVRHNLTLADGFLATEPLQVPYPQYGMSGERGPGLVLGHIELQRGGWAKSMRGKRKKFLNFARDRLTPFRKCVAPSLLAQTERTLDDYVASLNLRRDADLLYWINYRFRVCRWLTSHYLVHSRELLPIYPLVDEKVVRVVAEAPLDQLVSERLVFSTTSRLAPALRTMPLFRDRYRFEEKQRSWRNPCGYRAREPVQPAPSTYLKREVVMPGDIRPALCEAIRAGKLKHELREASLPALWAVIENPSSENIAAAGVDRKRLSSYLWTCYQASVLFTDGLEQ